MPRKQKNLKAVTTKNVRHAPQQNHVQPLGDNEIDSAVLDAVPAHIATVDAQGVILSVNEAWKSFAVANVFKGISYGIGSNYVEVCEESHGDCAEEALAVANGLRAVLSRKQECFTLEYPCHAPNQERWFRVMITQISGTDGARAMVMHLNVTERRKMEQVSRLSHQVFESSPDHISVVGHDYCYRQVNHAYEVAHDRSQEEIVGTHVISLLGEEAFKKIVKPQLDRGLAGESVSYESWFSFPALGQRFMTVTYTPLRAGDGVIDSIVVIARDLTERKLTDEALVKSEAQRRLAMGAAQVGTWTWNISNNEVTWSENVEEIFGLPPRSFAGTYERYLDLIHPSDLPSVKASIAETLDRDAPYNIEHRTIWPDGSTRWLSCRGNVFRDQSTGKPFWFAGIVVDITERKQTQEALEKEQEFIRNILHTTEALIVVLDSEWKVVGFNQACEELTGRRAEQVKGKSFLDLSVTSGEDYFSAQKLVAAMKSREFPRSFENAWVRHDRQLRWISWSNSVVRNKNAEIEYIIATGIDITERKEAEQSVLETKDRLEGIINTATDAVISIDDSQRIVLCNPAAERMFGYDAKEVIGKSLDQFLPQRFRRAHRGHVRQFGQTGVIPRAMGSLGMVFGIRATGEEFPIEASISKVGVGKRKLYTVILRDVTDRLKAEQALRNSEESLDLAIAGANLGTWDWDLKRGQVHINDRWAAMLGYTKEEIGPKLGAWKKLIHPDDRGRVMKTLQEHLDGRTVFYQEEYRLRSKAAKWKWILDSGKVVAHDANGKPQRATGIHQDVTARKEIEAELVKEQNFISAVLQTAGALVVVLNRQGGIVRFNRACEKLTGYSLEEVRGKFIWDVFLLPKEASAVKRVFRSLRHKPTPRYFEEHWMSKDKNPRSISWSSTTLANEAGRVDFVIWTGVDMTERKKAEQTIDYLWRQNELILYSAGEGIYGIDVNGKVTFFNRAAQELTGWTNDQVIEKPIHPVLHHTRADGTPYSWKECPIYASLTEGQTHQVATDVFWCKDGTHFPAEYISTPIHKEDGTIDGVVVTFKDITDRKKSEEALRESEARFQAFMNHSPAVAFLKDEKGRYVYVNRRFEEELNCSAKECLGKVDMQLFPPEVARTLRDHDRKALAVGGVIETEETTVDTRGNIRPWLVYKFPVTSPDGQQFLGGVALDLTQRKRAAEALAQREEELQSLGGKLISAQEDERRRISRELHDDMNQRLAVLALHIQTAQRGLTDSDPICQTLQTLYEQVSTLSDDVRHLAYQLHPSILDDLGLKVALQSFAQDFSQLEGLPIKVDAVRVPGKVSQHVASTLYRITQESLRNVAKHADASQVEVALTGEKGLLTLCIKDDGKGFDETAVRAGRHGLGLVGMQERVRLVQGTLEVNSSPGKGTEICVTVPIAMNES